MYEEIMKWVVAAMCCVAFYGGAMAIVQYFRKPYRKEIKAVDDRVEKLSERCSDIQGDDWARMMKMDTRLTAAIKALEDSRIPAVVCAECGCVVADGSQRQKQRVTYRDDKGFPVSPDVIAQRLETGGDHRFIRNVTVFNLCKRCAAEFEKNATVTKKEKSK